MAFQSGDAQVSKSMPFPPPTRSRSTSVGSSEENLREDDRTSPRSLQYPSLLDAKTKGQEAEVKATWPKSSSGVLGLPDIEYPLPWQLTGHVRETMSCPSSEIGAPPGLEHLGIPVLPNSSPASMVEVEPPPGLREQSIELDCGDGRQILIPTVHSNVPPPPAHSPTLPESLKFDLWQGPMGAMDLPDVPLPLLASLGSLNHGVGTCKPCAFIHTKGCSSGADCTFCHLCPPGEKKRRAKMTKQIAKMVDGAVSCGNQLLPSAV